ncbi:MAG TPA: hypothetical protein DCL44_00615 [Elusimicrobia bacterium]|nr:hypothetical protein [Elusimicrobiota bacterium]
MSPPEEGERTTTRKLRPGQPGQAGQTRTLAALYGPVLMEQYFNPPNLIFTPRHDGVALMFYNIYIDAALNWKLAVKARIIEESSVVKEYLTTPPKWQTI